MLKTLSILLIATIAIIATASNSVSASARTLIPVVPDMPFVHIVETNVMLYDAPNGRQITSLPQTYFAHVTGTVGDFFNVIFYDLTGFIRQNAVTKVDFEPITKFATGNLSVMRGGTVPIFSRPTHLEASAIFYTPRGASHIFYGTISGSIPYRTEEGYTWYFIRFLNSSGQNEWGYVHSSNVNSSVIPPNDVQKVMIYAPEEPIFTPPEFNFPPYLTVVFIVALCIPAILVMFLIFKKPKKSQEPKRAPRSF